MFENLVGNFHDAVALVDAGRFASHVKNHVKTFCLFFNLVSKTLFTPAILFVDLSAVRGNQFFKLFDNAVGCLFFKRFHDKNNLVLSHGIHLLFGLWFGLSPNREGQALNLTVAHYSTFIFFAQVILKICLQIFFLMV